MNIFQKLNKLFEIPSSDPDDARRRRLLNIILAGLVALGIPLLIYVIYLWFTQPRAVWVEGSSNLFFVSLVLVIISVVLFVLNRKTSSWVSSSIFLAFMIIGITFSDTPAELITGRSVFLFTIPIILSIVLLPSWTTFAASAIVIVIMRILQVQVNDPTINLTPTFIGIAFIALLAWLATRSLEVALRDLRKLNRELDLRVAQRTQELADSLSREKIESGRSKAILESIADGVIVFDLNGKSIIANPSSLEMLDLPSEQVIGTTIKGLSQSSQMDTFNRGMLHNILANPSSRANNYHIKWGRKELSVTSAPVVDLDGNSMGTVAVFRDYTHEAELERMKDTFLAIVSHELRTPLNAILGYAEMLKEAVYGPVNEKQAWASERIMTNTHRLLDIVSDLLDQAQMEAGKLSLHLQAFRPLDLVENVHSVMDKLAADKNLELTSELDPQVPEMIVGDIARLQQILVNLITNSVKFTEKGTVHMCISRQDKKHWRLAVSDTGIGISEEDLPNIFEAFRQVDSTATRKHGGFGLGLAIVKQLAELMEGEVEVKSVLGTGSEFTVTLPLIQVKRRED